MKKVIFYNHFGAGDIFESREFVKAWMKRLGKSDFYYAHGKNPRILLDIPELKYMEVTPDMSPMNAISLGDNHLYVNTWIGRNGKYVLPGIGCVVEMLYKMHNDMLHQIGLPTLRREPTEYIPKIDYLKYDIENVMRFLAENGDRRLVLISNGPVQSNQAFNFSFEEPIDIVARLFEDTIFIVTEPTNVKLPNIITTSEITKVDGFDLNEISYLSLFCDTIIGRNSGPHVFAQVLDNWYDSEKAILSFTYEQIASTFVLKDMPMKKYWSNATDTHEVVNKIVEVLDREREKDE